MFRSELTEAIRDYRYLLDKNYPPGATIKLVGDKYALTGVERSILYRGVSPELLAKNRLKKKSRIIYKNRVYIDTYNILFTLANYLMGKPLFIADDGFLRDTGELHGRLSNTKILNQTFDLLTSFLKKYGNKEYFTFLDQPVSNSGKLSQRFNDFFKNNSINGKSETVFSPDNLLIDAQSGIICTSDSIIIQNCKLKVYDLSEKILVTNFKPAFFSVQKALDLI